MYTFNGGLSAPPLLSIDSGGGGTGSNNEQNNLCAQIGSNNNNNNSTNTSNIPRTPEILNSLIAMTNPLEYSYPSDGTVVVSGNNCNVSTSNQVRFCIYLS